MRRSSNSCATIRCVGTLYAYMSVQARRTRFARGRERRIRARRDNGVRRLRVWLRAAYQKNLWCAGRHFFARSSHPFVAFVREVKFVVYYREP